MGCFSSDYRVSEKIIDEEQLLLQYGKRLKYDRSFKGPLQKRSCTDIPCLVIFIVFMVVWGFIGSYAFRNGDLSTVLVPANSLDQRCGVDSPVLNKPYLLFFNLEKCIDPLVTMAGCPTPTVCVEKCPTETFVWDTMKDSLTMEQLKERLICQTTADKNGITSMKDAEKAIKENRCARCYVQSTPLLNRCVWTFEPDRCEHFPSNLSSIWSPIAYNYETLPETSLVKQLRKGLANQKLKKENETDLQCSTRQKLSESIIREKIVKANSYLSRLIGNMAAGVYHGAEAQQVGEKVAEDVKGSWAVILHILLVVMIVSLIYIFLMRWVAIPVVSLSILGVLVLFAIGVYYSVTQLIYWSTSEARFKNIYEFPITWVYTTLVLGISFIVIFILVIVLFRRIRIAITIVKEGSKAVVSRVLSSAFFPILPSLLFICTLTLTVLIRLHLATIGEQSFKQQITNYDSLENCDCLSPDDDTLFGQGYRCEPAVFRNNCFSYDTKIPCVDEGCYFEKISNPTIISYLQVYNIVGFLWLSYFISALGDMVLAATFATWYWTFHKSYVPFFVLTRAIFRTIRYHLGTLALGPFMLTVGRIIPIILEFIDRKCKKFDNPVTRAITWCLNIFFINQNAYIMCAIHGNNFCVSSKESFNLFMRNFLRVIALNRVTDFLFLLCKLLVSGLAGVVTYFYFESITVVLHLNYIAVPVTIVVIATFFITSMFFGVYSIAIDTLFLCFLEDCERNDGSAEKPYFMSKQLMRILRKSNNMPRGLLQRM